MSFEVVEERVNPLLGRREAKLVVHHEGSGTPDRLSVRKMASDHFKAGLDRVFVRSIATRTGGSAALCVVEIYDDTKVASTVPEYLKNRNLPKDQRQSKAKKTGDEKPAAPPPKPAEKKSEAKPSEKKEEPKQAVTKEEKPAGKEARPAAKPESRTKA